MTTVSRDLPERPHLDVPKREARELLEAWRATQPEAFERIRRRHPKYRDAADETLKAAPFKLADAQELQREAVVALADARRRLDLARRLAGTEQPT